MGGMKMKSIKEEIKYIKTRNEIIKKLDDLAVQKGFLKVESDAFEEYCSYVSQNTRQDQTKLVKVQDLKGQVYLLKPDTTTNIIQQVIPRMEQDLELDLYYLDNVYRFDNAGSIQSIRQFGIEVIGRNDIRADIAMINVIQEVLNTFEIRYVMELGNQQFVNTLIQEVTNDQTQTNRIKQALISKNKQETLDLLPQDNIPVRLLFDAIISKQNDIEFYRNIIKTYQLSSTLESELDKVLQIIETLNDPKIEVDLSLINEFDYYNGPIYKVYVSSQNTNILRGGRYDYLTKEFGTQTGALGFSLDVDKLIEEVTSSE
jgi:ATP phosphoribosyltransferase regulatory subunit